jgi:hypothetical protein
VSEEPQPGGIVISGGSVEIGALAQGPHARASYEVVQSPGDQISAQQRENLASLLHDLLDVLQQQGNELPDRATVQAVVGEVSAELDQEHPDRSRVRRLLERIAAAAGPVSEIVAAVATLQRAISGMLSACDRSPAHLLGHGSFPARNAPFVRWSG